MTSESVDRPLGDLASPSDPQDRRRKRKTPGPARRWFEDSLLMNSIPQRLPREVGLELVEICYRNGELPGEMIKERNLENDEILLIEGIVACLLLSEVEFPESFPGLAPTSSNSVPVAREEYDYPIVVSDIAILRVFHEHSQDFAPSRVAIRQHRQAVLGELESLSEDSCECLGIVLCVPEPGNMLVFIDSNDERVAQAILGFVDVHRGHDSAPPNGSTH